MVDSVAGSVVSNQLQNTTASTFVGLKIAKEQTEAVIKNIDASTQAARANTDSSRGQNLDIAV